MQHVCRMCGGSASPHNGCQYTETFIVCGICTREAWRWLRNHINGKGLRNGLSFYDHARPFVSGSNEGNQS